MNYQIVTHNEIIGVHRWENAPEKYAYLRNIHRHVFVIRCKFSVTHSDREIEINDMQEFIDRHFKENFITDPSAGAGIFFGNMSCEDIARYCIDRFACDECEVLEDGFGGAYVRN